MHAVDMVRHAQTPSSMWMQAIIRAVCSIIDAFHFATEAAAGADALPAPAVLPSEGAVPAPASSAALDAAHGEDIQRALTRRVLPALQKQLVGLHLCLAWYQVVQCRSISSSC